MPGGDRRTISQRLSSEIVHFIRDLMTRHTGYFDGSTMYAVLGEAATNVMYGPLQQKHKEPERKMALSLFDEAMRYLYLN